MRALWVARALRVATLAFACSASVASIPACGGGEMATPKTAAGAALDLDADALGISLLPSGAIAAATIDARSLYDDHAFGADVARLAEGLLPLGVEAGFLPSRDVDRVTVAWYAVTGADFVAVVRGRIDPAAVQRAADAQSAAHAGGVLAATPYSGHTIYTMADVGFSVLTSHTALVGTAAGLRLALDRVRDGRVRAELSPALLETLGAQGAAIAFAGDFTSAPITAVQGMPLPAWAAGLQRVSATATLHDGRIQVIGGVGFQDAEHATSAANGLRQMGVLVNTVAIAGAVPELKSLDVGAEGSKVHVSFSVEDGQMQRLLKMASQWLPPPQARGPAASYSNIH